MAAIASHEPGMAGVFGGPLHAQAPRRPGPLPTRVLHPDEQFQQGQHFYPANPQAFFPYQWSMSSLCMPYSGFHGLGYGMMPLMLPSYLEVPGCVIPQAQLNMLDYRRMTPHVVPAAAHQTHRHFQNSVHVGRVMVSSEVQTEPVCHRMESHGQAERSDACSESGRGTGCGSTVSASPRSSDNKSIACPEGVSMLTQNYNTTDAIDTTLSVVPKSEILQTERIQIPFREMPSEPNITENNNTELGSYNETDLLQCSLGSVQSSEDFVLCSYKSLAFRKDKQTVEAGMLRYSRKHSLSSCTEVNVVKASPSCKTYPKTHPKSSKPQGISTTKNSKGKEDGSFSNNKFKILRLPFDSNQSCQLEASIWSVESLFPYVPSSEWMAKNGLLTPQKLCPLIEASEGISKLNHIPIEKNPQTHVSTNSRGLLHQLNTSVWSVESLMPYVPSNERMVDNRFLTPRKPLRPQFKSGDVLSELNLSSTDCFSVGKNGASTKSHGLPCQLEASVWSVESLMPYVPSREWIVENGYLTSEKPPSTPNKSSDVLSKPYSSSTNGLPMGRNLKTSASTKHEDSFDSFETCSTYRPSTSWLADFGNVYYYSKIPVGRQKSDNLGSQARKLSTGLESSLRNGEKPRNQRKATGNTGQKHRSSHPCEHNAKSSPRLAGSAIMCDCVSPSTMEGQFPFCPSCRYDTKGNVHKKLSISGGLCYESEPIAEAKTFGKLRSKDDLHYVRKMTMGSHLSESSAPHQAKLCEVCPCLHVTPAQDECGDLECFWEKSDKGQLIINHKKRPLQRPQKDRACKGSVQVSNAEKRSRQLQKRS